MRVICHGYLRDLVPNPVELAAKTVAEAIEALSAQFKSLWPLPGQARHQIKVVGFDTVESLHQPADVAEVHLVPDFSGGKSGGFVKILLGAVLIAASFIPGLNVALWAGASSFFFALGASFVLGGLLEVISPAPKRDTSTVQSDPETSKYLGAPKNTVAIGTRIPIGVGRFRIGGHYLAFDIQASDVAV